MRKRIWLVALSWLLLTGLCTAQKKAKTPPAPAPEPAPVEQPAPVVAPPAAPAVPAPPRRKRVAVIDFDYATVHSGISALFGQDVDVGKGITDLLVTFLVKDASYSVIERKALDKVMAEQNFSNSDRANPTSAAKLGKLLGVDAIIVGSITQFGNETKSSNLGGAAGGLVPFGLGNISHKKSKAIVAITARLVDVDTGEIVGVAEGKGESSRESTSLLGAGAGTKGFGTGAVDFASSDFQNTILGEAVKAAVQQTSAEVIADKDKLVTRRLCRRTGRCSRLWTNHPQCRIKDRPQSRRSVDGGARIEGNQGSVDREGDPSSGCADRSDSRD